MEKHTIVVPDEGREELNRKVDFVVAGQAAGTLNDYPAFVTNLFKGMGSPARSMMHACAGVAGEAGEILDIAKKVWVYNKPLDVSNLVEELGDIRFYYQAALCMLAVDDTHVRSRACDRRAIANDGTAADTLLKVCANMNVHGGNVLDVALELLDGLPLSGMDAPTLEGLLLDQLAAVRSYYSYLLEMMDLTDLHIQAHNMFKLSLNPDARFPGGVYTDAAAIARADKAAEGETVSSGVTAGAAVEQHMAGRAE